MARISLLTRLNTIHTVLAFTVPFLLLYPFVLFFATRKSWHRFALVLHRSWAQASFFLLFLPIKITWKYRPEKDQQYIFCANHFSFFDIPTMILLNVPFKFIGKASLTKVPLFGLMYKMIHITVDRASLKSGAKSQKEVIAAIDEGFNVAYFPEGGMFSTRPPKMVAFKGGAFRAAVAKQIPVVPVTLSTNYKVFPDDPRMVMHRGKIELTVHPPIHPKENTEQEVSELRSQVKIAIESGFN